MDAQPKNPFDEALALYTTKETLDPTLRTLHGLLSHTWTLSTLQVDQDNDQIAAESRVFAKMIRAVELKMNVPFQSFIHRKQVLHTTPPPQKSST